MKNGVQQTDLTYLKQITSNDMEEVKGFIEDILELLNEVIPKINAGNANEDCVSIKKNAHKLLSSVKIFGVQALAAKLLETEKECELNGISTSMKQSVEELVSDLRNWEEELKEILSEI